MRQRLSSPHRSELLAQRAGSMRARAMASEHLLWLHLRGRQLGVSFKRQVPLGGPHGALVPPLRHF
jgi:very-short-patch-repair endonuclease